MLSIAAAPIYVPTSSVQGPPFFMSSATCVAFMLAILTGARQYLLAGLICISLMINSVGTSFRMLSAICMSSLENCLFRSSAHFVIGLFQVAIWHLPYNTATSLPGIHPKNMKTLIKQIKYPPLCSPSIITIATTWKPPK